MLGRWAWGRRGREAGGGAVGGRGSVAAGGVEVAWTAWPRPGAGGGGRCGRGAALRRRWRAGVTAGGDCVGVGCPRAYGGGSRAAAATTRRPRMSAWVAPDEGGVDMSARPRVSGGGAAAGGRAPAPRGELGTGEVVPGQGARAASGSRPGRGRGPTCRPGAGTGRGEQAAEGGGKAAAGPGWSGGSEGMRGDRTRQRVGARSVGSGGGGHGEGSGEGGGRGSRRRTAARG